MKKVIGADISFYQDLPETPQGVDFDKMKSAADFVIIRAGQNLWADPDFQVNWNAARGAGLPRGSYWFYDNRVDPLRQAELWFQILSGDLGELPLFADIEHQLKGQYSGWRMWYDFLERIKTLVGDKEIGIYTSPGYWREHAPNTLTQTDNLEYFHRYPLWIAHYGVDSPRLPKPWDSEEWLLWQFSSVGDGKAFGAESKGIDLNYFNGDVEVFQRRFSLPETDPDPIDTGRYVVDLSLRFAPTEDSHSTLALKHGDELELLETSQDGDWLHVRLADGSSGWSRKNYLQFLETPPPPVEYPVGSWYLVLAATLNVRDGPGAAYRVAGSLKQDQMVKAVAQSADREWLQIRREDGLTGWCSKKYLIKLGTRSDEKLPEATPLKENIFPGVDYIRAIHSQPRPMVVHVLSIDLHKDGMQFLVTPADRTDGAPLCTRTTSRFLAEHKLQIAINGDGFSYLNPAQFDPLDYCRNGGDPVRPNGFSASRGKAYSKGTRFQPVVYIQSNNSIAFGAYGGNLYNAISGDRMLVDKGKPLAGLSVDVPEPRTALGLSRNGRTLILMVVDGRQPEYSSGAALTDLANLLIEYGAYTSLNLDGGGSSTMVVEGKNGQPRLLNSPIDNNVPGRERAVANHLGIYINK